MSLWNVFSLLKAQERREKCELTLASYWLTKYKRELKNLKKSMSGFFSLSVRSQVLNPVPTTVWVPSTCGPGTRAWGRWPSKAREELSHVGGPLANAVGACQGHFLHRGRPLWNVDQRRPVRPGRAAGGGRAWVGCQQALRQSAAIFFLCK